MKNYVDKVAECSVIAKDGGDELVIEIIVSEIPLSVEHVCNDVCTVKAGNSINDLVDIVMTELLTGTMNYDAIMAACADAGMRDLFVEQDQVFMDSIDSMKISHDNMKARYDLD